VLIRRKKQPSNQAVLSWLSKALSNFGPLRKVIAMAPPTQTPVPITFATLFILLLFILSNPTMMEIMKVTAGIRLVMAQAMDEEDKSIPLK
jgi:hypothetical protein